MLVILFSILHYTIEGDAQERLCFQETGICIDPVFQNFWQSNGLDFGEAGVTRNESIALWGYPLSRASMQTNADGDRVLTQVFERMVFEHHPNNAGTVYEIQLRRMGAELRLPSTPTPTSTQIVTDEPTCLNKTEAEFLQLINDYRRANGLTQLKVSAAINKAAYAHSLDMGQRNYFAHNTLEPVPAWQGGVTFSDRMRGMGYTYTTGRGENIAGGQSTAQIVFNSWKNSPGHNRNMLNANFKVIGIGFVQVPNSRYVYYWTTDFGGYVDAAPVCE